MWTENAAWVATNLVFTEYRTSVLEGEGAKYANERQGELTQAYKKHTEGTRGMRGVRVGEGRGGHGCGSRNAGETGDGKRARKSREVRCKIGRQGPRGKKEGVFARVAQGRQAAWKEQVHGAFVGPLTHTGYSTHPP